VAVNLQIVKRPSWLNQARPTHKPNNPTPQPLLPQPTLMSFQTSSMVLVVLEVRSPRQEVENGEAEDDEDVEEIALENDGDW
jgi:hypothetical protein